MFIFVSMPWRDGRTSHDGSHTLLRASGAVLHASVDVVAASVTLMTTYRPARSRMHPAVLHAAAVAAPQPIPVAQVSLASVFTLDWFPSIPWLGYLRYRPHPCCFQLAYRPSLLNRGRTHAFKKGKLKKLE